MKNKQHLSYHRSTYLNYLLIIVASLLSACTEEFDLELDKNEQRLVVEGWITNLPGPQLIRLTKTSGNMARPEFDETATDKSTQPVTDAFIIIHDNAGVVDTLQPKASSPDTFLNIKNGYYETTKLQGIPGRTYSLYIKSEGKEYRAQAYMPPVPAVESVSAIDVPNPMKNENMLVPTVSFQEPQGTKDYYLFMYDDYFMDAGEVLLPPTPYLLRWSGGNNWGVSILRDELLPAYVKDYPIDDGVSPTGQDFYYITEGQYFRVNMYSLTKEAYDFYKALIEQFNNDGGAYQPAPASPPTNISNGAGGFFGASAVSYKAGVFIK